MPANLFSELDNLTSSHLENDNRAMAIALELTMLRLNDPDISPANSLPESLSLSQPESPLGLASPHLTSFLQDSAEDLRNKKSANMTECVPVPSSEHVAEIVGRQGCKIKALRAKTNTYIKTPVRHEEPVFVVTGRKEDVCRAKREILSAADHFSALRASRKSGALSPLSPPTGVPGHVTIEVRVPYKVVGLVVGPKGATIKRIQHQTNTYIVTPSRDKEPVFEVTGAPDSVEIARAEIESHIIRRTGSCITPPACADPLLGGSMPCPPCGGGSDDGMAALPSSADLLLASLCNSGLGSLGTILNYVGQQGVGHGGVGHGGMGHGGMGQGGGYEGDHQFTNGFTPLGMMGMNGLGSASQGNHHMFSSSSGCSSASSSSSSTSAPNTSSGLDLTSIWSGMSSLDKDEGLGDSSPSFSGGDSTPSPVGTQPPSSSSIWSYPPLSSASPSGSVSGGSSSRACYVCADRDVTHALVPCGHNLFCSECADRTVDFDRLCPVCRSPVHQAMRIIS